jgi:hypothetical protein
MKMSIVNESELVITEVYTVVALPPQSRKNEERNAQENFVLGVAALISHILPLCYAHFYFHG